MLRFNFWEIFSDIMKMKNYKRLILMNLKKFYIKYFYL